MTSRTAQVNLDYFGLWDEIVLGQDALCPLGISTKHGEQRNIPRHKKHPRNATHPQYVYQYRKRKRKFISAIED
jgi:hypothetical protein